MQIKNYNKFSDLPFEQLEEDFQLDPENSVKNFANSVGLKHKVSWFWPQLAAHISQFRVAKDKDGLISAKSFLVDNFSNNKFNQGIYRLCMSKLRSPFLATQYQEPQLQYCALVPLLLMPFKKLRNIDYSSWNRNELRHVLDPQLWEAVEYAKQPILSEEPPDWLHFRAVGLKIRTGPKAGESNNPVKHHRLNNAKDLPWLYYVMKCQIWCAHPSNRHKYMILDPLNLDEMPEPLISTEVLVKPEIKNPWDVD